MQSLGSLYVSAWHAQIAAHPAIELAAELTVLQHRIEASHCYRHAVTLLPPAHNCATTNLQEGSGDAMSANLARKTVDALRRLGREGKLSNREKVHLIADVIQVLHLNACARWSCVEPQRSIPVFPCTGNKQRMLCTHFQSAAACCTFML